MNRCRVVHLCRGRDWRGGERQVRLLVRMLSRQGVIDQLVATGQGSPLAAALRDEDRDVLSLPWSLAWDPRSWLGLARRLTRLSAGGGRVLLHAHDSHALALGLAASRRFGLPLVATRRSLAAAGPLWRFPERIIAISAAVEQSLLAIGVPRARLIRIPSGIDVAEVRRAVPVGKSTSPCVIAAGALTPEKGHATLIDAFALLLPMWPEARLLLLGGGAERSRLETRAKRRGVAARVEFGGEVAEATSRIAAAELFVQPSLREALGTAVLEAMALGIPVVASRTGGLVELIGGGAGMLVPPGDAAPLAQAMDQLLRTPRLRASVTETARARVTQFDASGMAERVAEVYRSALGDT